MAWLDAELQNEERHAMLADRLGRAERSGDLSLVAKIKQSISDLFNAEWGALLAENVRGNRHLDDYLASVTTGAPKKAWIIDRQMKLVGVRINTRASDRTTGSDVIDINKNNTTMFTTKPTQAAATIGDWTVVAPDAGLADLKAGDEISYDVDTASTGGTGKTIISLVILLRHV